MNIKGHSKLEKTIRGLLIKESYSLRQQGKKQGKKVYIQKSNFLF